MATASDLDRLPTAPRGSLGGVPVIDLAGDGQNILDQIDQACRDWGFFQVVGHGVTAEAPQRLLDVARQFFAQPRPDKRGFLRSRDNPWGYYDRELTKEQRDRKEIFDIGPDAGGISESSAQPFAGATPWPNSPPGFRAVIEDWFARMTDLSARLTSLIAAAISGNPDGLRPAFQPAHTSFLRLNFYPVEDPLAGEAEAPAELGIHHHTDAGALTVLLQDGVGGLQVYRDGLWHDVDPMADAFTINIGDMVQVWSNDLYRAPVHRVLGMDRHERLSVPFFYNPAYEATIEPLTGRPLYRPLNWGEFRRRRADGDFADYGTEVQIGEWRIAGA